MFFAPRYLRRHHQEAGHRGAPGDLVAHVNPLVPYLPIDRLRSLIRDEEFPEWAAGAVLFADVSGFTPLTASLARDLGPRRGAEELTRVLNAVYEVLIAEVHGHGGSVVTFSGDAITCFFEEGASTTAAPAPERAARAALRMHHAIASVRSMSASAVSLSIRTAFEAGRVRRFLVGNPEIQVLEVLAGATVDRLGVAAHLAGHGEVVGGPAAIRTLGTRLQIAAARAGPDAERYDVITGVSGNHQDNPWDDLSASDLAHARLRAWLLPTIYERLCLGQVDFLAELRPATVVFLQFGGLDYEAHEHAGVELDAFVRSVQGAVTRMDGTVFHVSTGDKGSCLYAAFGAPIAHEDDAARAVETALRLLAIPGELAFITDVRIGIGHGRMWTGPYGSSVRKTYGVLGDETNLAARLMEAAPLGTILVSEAVVAAAGGRDGFTDRGAITVKGRERPVPVFEPRRSGHLRAPVSTRTTMIGRERELRLVQECLHALEQRQAGGIVFIEGEPGIGKSCLIGELADLATRAHLKVAMGVASAIERSTPYYVWRSVLADVLSTGSPVAPPRLREQVQAELHDDATLARWLPLLNDFLPTAVPENEFTVAMTGEIRAESTHTLVAALLSRVGQRAGGLVLVLEDAHWFDSASWALARRVSRDASSVLLVIGTRPMQPAPPDCVALLQSPHAITVPLEPLTAAEALQLVARRLEVDTLPRPVEALIGEKAQGNPFFAEELAYALRDNHVIRTSGRRCEIAAGADLNALHFPDTVEGVVRSRIDQLSASQQLIVKLASVIGRIFPFDVLSEIYPADADRSRLRDDLAMLERLDMVPVHSREPELTYRFKHVITQDVAYDLLLFGQKRELHREVAEWYERAHGDDLPLYYALLAHHWGSARVTPKTAHYLEKAGDQALNNDANEEAGRFFSQAILLMDGAANREAWDDWLPDAADPLRRARWDLRLGEVHHRMGLLTESERHFREALRRLDHGVPDSTPALLRGVTVELVRQASRRLHPPRQRTSVVSDGRAVESTLAHAAYERLAELSFLHGRSGLLVYGTLRSLNLAETEGPSRELAHGYAAVCVACGLVPSHALARLYQRKAVELAERLGDAAAAADVFLTTSLYTAGVGHFALTEQRLREAMILFERFGNFHRWGLCMQALCRVAWSQGDLKQLAELTDALHLCGRRRDDCLQQIWGLNNRAEYTLLKGDDPAIALHACEESLALIAQSNEIAAHVIARGLIAQAEIRRGNGAAALAAAEAALLSISSSSRPTSFGMLTAYAATADAYLSLWEDHTRFGVAALEERALAACRSLNQFARVFPIGQPRAALYQGRYFYLTGHRPKAHKLWTTALAHATRLAMPYEAALVLYEIGRHLPTTDPRREDHLWRARDAFSGLDARYDEAQAGAQLAHAVSATPI